MNLVPSASAVQPKPRADFALPKQFSPTRSGNRPPERPPLFRFFHPLAYALSVCCVPPANLVIILDIPRHKFRLSKVPSSCCLSPCYTDIIFPALLSRINGRAQPPLRVERLPLLAADEPACERTVLAANEGLEVLVVRGGRVGRGTMLHSEVGARGTAASDGRKGLGRPPRESEGGSARRSRVQLLLDRRVRLEQTQFAEAGPATSTSAKKRERGKAAETLAESFPLTVASRRVVRLFCVCLRRLGGCRY